jgi:hypothetical protein
VRSGDLLGIPLYPYRISTSPGHAAIGGIALIREMLTGRPMVSSAIATHTIVGTPFEPLPDEWMRMWLGFAIQTS